MSPLSSVDRHRGNNLNLIRLCLAVLVIFSHSFPLLRGLEARDWADTFTRGQENFGGLAVDGFFALSGFLILSSWLHRPALGAFFRNRILRIYPGFLVASAISVGVVGLLAAPAPLHYAREVYWNLSGTLLPTLTLDAPQTPATLLGNPAPSFVNGSLWTVRYEFWCYILIAVLGALRIWRSRIGVLSAFVLAYGLHAAQSTWHLWRAEVPFVGHLSEWPHFLAYFMAGAVAFAYRDCIPRSRALFWAAAAGMVACAAIGVGLAWWLPVAGVYALLYLGFHSTVVTTWFTRDGRDWSYGTYLYAFPIQQVLVFTLGPLLNPYTLFALALGLTLLFAAASWRLVEHPALQRKQPRGQLARAIS